MGDMVAGVLGFPFHEQARVGPQTFIVDQRQRIVEGPGEIGFECQRGERQGVDEVAYRRAARVELKGNIVVETKIQFSVLDRRHLLSSKDAVYRHLRMDPSQTMKAIG